MYGSIVYYVREYCGRVYCCTLYGCWVYVGYGAALEYMVMRYTAVLCAVKGYTAVGYTELLL